MTDYILHPGNPERLSWEDFVRPHSVGHLAYDDPTGFESRSSPVGTGREFGEFSIHRGCYHVDLEKNAAIVAKRGTPVVAVLPLKFGIVGVVGRTVVASVTALSLWTHMLYRQKSLAVEVIVDRVRYTGAEEFVRFHREREARGEKMRYTPEGLLAMRAAYDAMIKRGLITP